MDKDIVLLGLSDDTYFSFLTCFRPISEFRIGGFSLREKLQLLYKERNIYIFLNNKKLEKLMAEKYSLIAEELPDNKFITINIKTISSIDGLESLVKYVSSMDTGSFILQNNELVCGIFDRDTLFRYIEKGAGKKRSLPSRDIILLNEPWKIPKLQGELIRDDALSKHIKPKYILAKPHKGEWPILLSRDGVKIEKYVYMESSNGPIIINNDVEIHAFSRISGPTVIRENSIILSGLIRGNSVIGPVCKIGGEISDTLIDGYTNISHKSYIGHSYIGMWVNIGAFTVTSDLKNTYGEIRVYFNNKWINTGLQKLGSFIGDHVKTGISTQIYGGKYIGCFSHVLGLVYTNIPPFTIWDGYSRKLYELNIDKAIETAIRMYRRRDVEMIPEEKEYIKYIYQKTKHYREGAIKGRISFN